MEYQGTEFHDRTPALCGVGGVKVCYGPYQQAIIIASMKEGSGECSGECLEYWQGLCEA